jgi:hypothetical protein
LAYAGASSRCWSDGLASAIAVPTRITKKASVRITRFRWARLGRDCVLRKIGISCCGPDENSRHWRSWRRVRRHKCPPIELAARRNLASGKSARFATAPGLGRGARGRGGAKRAKWRHDHDPRLRPTHRSKRSRDSIDIAARFGSQFEPQALSMARVALCRRSANFRLFSALSTFASNLACPIHPGEGWDQMLRCENVVEARSLLRRGLPNAISAATIPKERRFALAEVATWVGAGSTENASSDRLSTLGRCRAG